MKIPKITAIALAAAACVSALHAQNYRDSSRSDRDYSTDRYRSSSDSRGNSELQQVRRANRASNIIGQDVRDNHNQKIGEIKDVVIDFDSGRVAYLVLDANNVLEGNSTWVAI